MVGFERERESDGSVGRGGGESECCEDGCGYEQRENGDQPKGFEHGSSSKPRLPQGPGIWGYVAVGRCVLLQNELPGRFPQCPEMATCEAEFQLIHKTLTLVVIGDEVGGR